MIKITADSTADLGEHFLKRNIVSFPLSVILGDDTFSDGFDITPDDIYKFVAEHNKLPKTAARSEEEYEEFFGKLTADGSYVIHFALSNGISASYEQASKAAEKNNHVYVINTRSLSSGTGLLALYAADLRDENKFSAAEIYEKCLKRVDFIQASFVVDTMEYLYKGGRCSGLASFFASALKIKPSLILRDGLITVGPKYMGSIAKCVEKYCENIIATYPHADKTRVFVTHSSADPKTVEIAKRIVRDKINPNEIIETVAGSVITSHCGKGTLGILYINDAE